MVIEVPEVVGVFDNVKDMQTTIYDLMMAGFSRYDISLLGSEEAMKERLGSAFLTASELADNPDAPRAAFVSEEAMGEFEGAIAGGLFFLGSAIAMTALLTPASTIAASIAAVAIGGSPGAVLGTILARRAGRHHKDYYEHQIRNGGILIWVRVNTPEKEEIATKIMQGHSGHEVHKHDWSE